MDLNASALEIAKAIKNLWQNEAQYQTMCFRARQIYDEQTGPTAWVRSVNQVMDSILSEG